MTAKVFISYRRDDSAGHAGRVHDRLEQEFGRDLLFMDVDAIPLGVDFVKALDEAVAKCEVLLAIIGTGWLDMRDEDGTRRLENIHDFVRIEIAAALKRNIPVIPILLEGTTMPKAVQLPDDLKDLALRNGLNVRHASFRSDMDKLIRDLRRQKLPQEPAPGRVAKQSTDASKDDINAVMRAEKATLFIKIKSDTIAKIVGTYGRWDKSDAMFGDEVETPGVAYFFGNYSPLSN